MSETLKWVAYIAAYVAFLPGLYVVATYTSAFWDCQHGYWATAGYSLLFIGAGAFFATVGVIMDEEKTGRAFSHLDTPYVQHRSNLDLGANLAMLYGAGCIYGLVLFIHMLVKLHSN